MASTGGLRIVNRITVADVMKGAQAQKTDPKTGELLFNDDKTPKMGPVDMNVPQRLYLLVGRARDTKTAVTQYGNYREYFGAFEAKRFCDSTVFKGGRCILPPPTDAVVENVYLTEKQADPNAEVSFAFIIGTEEHRHGDEKKFRYTCEPLNVGDRVEQDPLAAIKQAIEEELNGLLQIEHKPAPAIEDKTPAKKQQKG